MTDIDTGLINFDWSKLNPYPAETESCKPLPPEPGQPVHPCILARCYIAL